MHLKYYCLHSGLRYAFNKTKLCKYGRHTIYHSTESNSTHSPKPILPMRQQTPSTVMVDSSPLSSPTSSTVEPADPLSYHHLPLDAHPPIFESTGNQLQVSITPESQAAITRAEDIFNREIHARKNNAHARSEMTRKYNKRARNSTRFSLRICRRRLRKLLAASATSAAIQSLS